MMPREQLPNRRRSETIDTVFRDAHYAIVFSRFTDGRIGEVFIEPRKVGSDAAEDSRDVGIVLSLALQFGVPLATIRRAMSRVHGGLPASLSGHIADCLVAESADNIGGAT